MENVIKNMEIVIKKINSNLEEKHVNGNLIKTLSNTYQSLLNHFKVIPHNEKIKYEHLKELRKHKNELVSINDKLLSDILQKTLENGELRQADIIATACDKMNRLIYDLKHIIEIGYSSNIKGTVWRLLNKSLKENRLVTVPKVLRGSGKTLSLAIRCCELNAALVVPYQIQEEYIKKELGFDIEVLVGKDKDLFFGKPMKSKKFLVDEGVTQEAIEKLILCGREFLGGFKN
ncbi:hypothetical protein MHB40_14390 [Lysinibacillus sp. FSL K6-0057]|uniref:hypothetical protein n=1 Tax=Lysinibacillus sp. FSL K6-0057 TaxID=2921411 RepID=UPI00315A48A8